MSRTMPRRLQSAPSLPLAPLISAANIIAAHNYLSDFHARQRGIERDQSYKKGKAGQEPGLLADASMAKRSRTRTTTRKRSKRARRGRLRRVRRVPSLFPSSKLVRMRAVTAFSTSPDTPGTIKTHTIKWNSLSQPFGGLSNVLPLGCDQWAAMYRRYCVVGAKLFIKVHNVTSTGAVTYGLTPYAAGNTTAATEAAGFLEMPGTRSRLLSPDMDHSGLAIGMSTKRYAHVRNLKDAHNLHGDLAAQPSAPTTELRAYFWHHDTNATETYTIEGFLTIEVVVLLLDRILPTRSAY